MTRITGACLSQFHNDAENYELLIAHSDGREIGHVVSKDHALSITRDMAKELGMDDAYAFASMVSALEHLREVFGYDHVVIKGNVDLKAGVLEVIDTALSRAALSTPELSNG